MGSTVAGLALVYSMNFTSNLTFLTRAHSDSQMNMNSVERVLEYCNIEQEKYLPDKIYERPEKIGGDDGIEMISPLLSSDSSSIKLMGKSDSAISDYCGHSGVGSDLASLTFESQYLTPQKQNQPSSPSFPSSVTPFSPATPLYHTPLSSPAPAGLLPHPIHPSTHTSTHASTDTSTHASAAIPSAPSSSAVCLLPPSHTSRVMSSPVNSLTVSGVHSPMSTLHEPLEGHKPYDPMGPKPQYPMGPKPYDPMGPKPSVFTTITPLSRAPRGSHTIVPDNWPLEGRVTFDGVSMRYRDNTPSVLRWAVSMLIFTQRVQYLHYAQTDIVALNVQPYFTSSLDT